MATGFHATLAVLACGALATGLSGCATEGAGMGQVSGTGAPTTFTWRSDTGDGTTGTMSAVVDGQTFTGPYLQITHAVRTESFAPMWRGWRYGWADWYGWPAFPTTDYSTVYSGRVMANLQGPGGGLMRCRFFLANPNAGMVGGGHGECQSSGGQTISASFPRGRTVAAANR